MKAYVTLFWLAVTFGAYRLSLEARKRSASPLTTPVLFSTAALIAVLLATHGTLRQYESAKEIITMFLGPATVALAIPLFKNRGGWEQKPYLPSQDSLPAHSQRWSSQL